MKLKEKLANREKIYSTMLCEWNNTRLPEVYKNCCDGGEKLAAAYDRKRLAAEMLEIISK